MWATKQHWLVNGSGWHWMFNHDTCRAPGSHWSDKEQISQQIIRQTVNCCCCCSWCWQTQCIVIAKCVKEEQPCVFVSMQNFCCQQQTTAASRQLAKLTNIQNDAVHQIWLLRKIVKNALLFVVVVDMFASCKHGPASRAPVTNWQKDQKMVIANCGISRFVLEMSMMLWMSGLRHCKSTTCCFGGSQLGLTKATLADDAALWTFISFLNTDVQVTVMLGAALCVALVDRSRTQHGQSLQNLDRGLCWVPHCSVSGSSSIDDVQWALAENFHNTSTVLLGHKPVKLLPRFWKDWCTL